LGRGGEGARRELDPPYGSLHKKSQGGFTEARKQPWRRTEQQDPPARGGSHATRSSIESRPQVRGAKGGPARGPLGKKCPQSRHRELDRFRRKKKKKDGKKTYLRSKGGEVYTSGLTSNPGYQERKSEPGKGKLRLGQLGVFERRDRPWIKKKKGF